MDSVFSFSRNSSKDSCTNGSQQTDALTLQSRGARWQNGKSPLKAYGKKRGRVFLSRGS